MKVNPTERALQAKELFLEGYNCAQSVFLAYADIVGMEPELAATISAPFGGGMGRLREVCGAVSGMTMVAGMLYPNSQPNDTPRKRQLMPQYRIWPNVSEPRMAISFVANYWV